MEGILLDTMFDLPSLEGVEEVVISRKWSRATPGRSTSMPTASPSDGERSSGAIRREQCVPAPGETASAPRICLKRLA